MQHYIIGTLSEYKDLVSYISENAFDVVALDFETDSVNEVSARPYGIGLAFQTDEAFYIPIRRNDGTSWWTDEQQAEIIQWIYTICSTKRLIGHNIVYDVLVFYHYFNYDLTPFIYSDTILLKHMVDEEPPFALKEIAVKYLGPGADQAQKDMYDSILKNGGSITKSNLEMFKADTDILGKYCAHDVMLTMQLFELFSKKLKAEGLEKLFYEDEVMPLYREVTIPMKLHGVRIDTEHFNQVREKIKVKVQDIENHLYSEISHLVAPFEHALLERDYPEKRTGNYPKEVAKLVGLEVTSLAKKAIEKLEVTTLAQINFKDWILGNVDALLLNKVDVQKSLFFSKHSERLHVFNFKSKDHLKHLFFEVLGEKPLSTTEGGEPQVDDAFLASVEADYPWVDLLRDLNVLHKMSGTYIEGILDRTIDGKLYTSFLQFGTTSGRFASRSPNCLSLDTEILTKDGFKNYYSFGPDDYVACYDGANIVWEKPSRKVFVEKSPKQIISVHNQHLNMRMTGDHRVIYRDRRTNLIQECPANRFPKDAHILHGANLVGGEIEVEENLLKFLVAFQADGNYSSTNVLEFKFDKLRKIDRLLGILANLGWSYEYKIVGTGARQRHKVRIHGKTNLVADVLGSGKTFPTSWINLTASCRDTFINELFYWDGSYTRRNNYSSNVEKNVDIAQALLSLSGYRAHKRIYRTSAGNNNYQLDISGRDYSGTSNATITSEISNEEVWCVTVPTGMILARRGSDTFITGNCQNWPAQQKTDTEGMTSKLAAHKKDMDWIVNSIRHGIVANPGYKLIGTDYSSLEPHIAAYVSGDKDLIDIFVQGKDFYSAIAIKQFDLGHLSAFKDDANYLGNVDKARRNLTKTYSLAAFYGATASRISQVLNCPKEEAQELLDGYLEAFPGIKSFIDRSHRDCMYTGKVKTLFGRVRHLSEAKVLYSSYGDQLKDFVWAQKRGLLDERKTYRNLLNNAVNFQIQGAAAHVLNRGMIAMTREFKRLNLDARIVMGVHDETIVEAKEEHVSEVAKVIKECMENAVDINPIKLKATPIVGNSYGDLK